MKSQADARCEVCAGSLFRDMKFVGCECLVDLAKSVNTKVFENFLELTFSEDMDQDAWLCLASLVR